MSTQEKMSRLSMTTGGATFECTPLHCEGVKARGNTGAPLPAPGPMAEKWVAIDVETTGEDPARHRIVTLAAAELDEEMKPIRSWLWMVRPEPGDPWEAEAEAIHGYSRHDALLQGYPEWYVMRMFCQWLWARHAPECWDGEGALALPPLIIPLAHNAMFDRSFIEAAARRSKVHLPLSYRWRCSQVAFAMWRDVHQIPGSTSLKELAVLSGHWTEAEEVAKHHDATADALACAAGYRWLVEGLRGAMAARKTEASLPLGQ